MILSRLADFFAIRVRQGPDANGRGVYAAAQASMPFARPTIGIAPTLRTPFGVRKRLSAPISTYFVRNMFMMPGRVIRCVGVALGMFAALAACGRQTAGAAAQSYEIVTQTRPESQEAYMRVYRQAHDVCAHVRAIQNLPPPPPLVALPADFVIKRSTYLSSGRDYLIRHEDFNVEIDETDCKSSIRSNMTESLVRGGKVYGQRREVDGHTETDEPMLLSQPSVDGSSFTEKRTVGGIAVRCGPAALSTDIALEVCAADAGAGVLLDGLGYPIILHARGIVPVRNMVVVTDPVSVQIGKPVPQARIALSGAK